VPGLVARPCGADEREGWIAASVAGWAEAPELAVMMERMARAASENPLAVSFLVERGGEPIATGSLAIHEGVALLAGASTIPARRGLGAQGLLLAARLDEARRRGCELAMMVAEPGSTSQRNAERRGFRVAYTRTKWRRERR
jgi:GNAT superfamily N-acetyltransferase